MRMPTQKQRRLAKTMSENLGNKDNLTLSDLLGLVGYSEKTIDKNSCQILKAPGTIKALAEFGFTEENAKGVVSEILLDRRKKDSDRLKAAEQVFKVTGSYAPEKSINLEVSLEGKDVSKFKELKDEYERKLLEKIQND